MISGKQLIPRKKKNVHLPAALVRGAMVALWPRSLQAWSRMVRMVFLGGTSLHDIRWGDVAFAKEGCNERNDVILVCEICPIFNHGIYHDMMGIMMI